MKYYFVTLPRGVLITAVFISLIGCQQTDFPSTESIEGEIVYATKLKGIDWRRNVNWEIYAIRPVGKNQRRLTNNDYYNDMNPSCSPDGKKIAFTSWRESDKPEIYIIDVDGKNEVKLGVYCARGSLSWTPDSKKIIFIAKVINEKIRKIGIEIYIMNSDGTDKKRLTYDWSCNSHPSCSPDGKKIVFDRLDYNSEIGGIGEIYIMDIEGKNKIRLTNKKDCSPSWSPDGKKIVFYSYRDGNAEIYVMDSDGSNQIRLTRNKAQDTQPCWSPDGKWIAFVSNRDGNDEIYIMTNEGRKQKRLTYNSTDDEHPSWRPIVKK